MVGFRGWHASLFLWAHVRPCVPVCVRIIGMLTRTKVTLCLRSCEFVVACKDACVGAIRTSGSVANYVLHFVGCMCNGRVLLLQFSFVLRSLVCAVCLCIHLCVVQLVQLVRLA